MWSCGPAFEAVAKFSGCRGFRDFMSCSVSKLIKKVCKYKSGNKTKTGSPPPVESLVKLLFERMQFSWQTNEIIKPTRTNSIQLERAGK